MLYFILATATVFGIALLNTDAFKNVFFDTGYKIYEVCEFFYQKYLEATEIHVYRGKSNKYHKA